MHSVAKHAMRIEKIYDEEGHFDDSGAFYCYECQYVTNINDVTDFYVIAEILRGTDGTLTKTGNNYAVNAYTGEMFRLRKEKSGKWLLLIIEEPEIENSDDDNNDNDEDYDDDNDDEDYNDNGDNNDNEDYDDED